MGPPKNALKQKKNILPNNYKNDKLIQVHKYIGAEHRTSSFFVGQILKYFAALKKKKQSKHPPWKIPLKNESYTY